MQDPIKILGVPVHAMTMQEAVKTLEERMLAKEQTFVVTANAEIIMMCQENADYKKIICEDAELVLPDGSRCRVGRQTPWLQGAGACSRL